MRLQDAIAIVTNPTPKKTPRVRNRKPRTEAEKAQRKQYDAENRDAINQARRERWQANAEAINQARRAKRAEEAKNKVRKIAKPHEWNHGTITCYAKRKCRCDLCRQASAIAKQRQKANRLAQQGDKAK
jgi:hypothetical protein